MKALLHLVAALLLQTPALSMAQPVVPRYRIDLLPTPPAGFNLAPHKINNRGMVAGSIFEAVNGSPEAFVYRAGRLTPLGTLGGLASEATDLNERGDVVGNLTHLDGVVRPFLYRRGRMAEIPLPDGARGDAEALDINNTGHVLGRVYQETGGVRAFFYDGRRSVFLDDAGLSSPSFAALNDRDEIAGDAIAADNNDRDALIYHQGMVTRLPPPPDADPLRDITRSFVVGFNNAGQVLLNNHGTIDGHAEDEDYAFIYQDGRYTQFGPNFFQANSMNERGWALGVSYDGFDEVVVTPGLYRDGSFHTLDELVRPADAGRWTWAYVRGINDFGAFVGRASGSAFIARPVPEPAAAVMMLVGLYAIGVARRRRGS